MQKLHFSILFSVLFLFGVVFFVPNLVSAEQTSTERSLRTQVDAQMRAVPGLKEGYESQDPREVIAGVIQTAMIFLGSIFLILILFSGYLLLTARGDSEKVQKSKDTMRRAVIGLFLCLSAYSISAFVLSRLQKTILEEPYDDPSNDCVDWLGCDDDR